jgi:oligopeptidase B
MTPNATAYPSGVPAPAAKRLPHRWNRPNGEVADEYAWLRDRNDPDTIAYLEAENAHTNEWFAPSTGLLEELFGEIRSRVQETDLSPPVEHAGWWYLMRTEQDRSYPILCRAASREEAEDPARATVLLDQNLEAEGHEYFDLGIFDISPSHGLLAWSADTSGDEHYTMRIRDLATVEDLADELTDTSWAGSAWSRDCRYLFYVTTDEFERPYRVWRHEIGTPQSSDISIFTEDDERFYVGLGLTRSEDWIIIQSGSKTSSEQWLLRSDDPLGAPQVVRPRTEDLEYEIDHWGDRFVVLTNLEAVDFRIMSAPLDDPGEWVEFEPHEPGRRIVGIEPFATHLVVHEWAEAQPRLRVIRRTNDTITREVLDPSSLAVGSASEPHDINIGPNPDWLSTTLRVTYQSLTTPLTIADIKLATGEIDIVKRTPTPNVDLGRYTATREWVTAGDGTLVPLDIIRHVDTPVDGTAAGVLYGYGSYEASMPPWFSVARLSLLDRGAIFALVHPRGGGELGRQWYLSGKLLNKRNTFTDTLAAAHHLIDNRWVAANRLAVRGGSAGGLLVGACVTMEPDTFAAAVAEVPFVDVVTTMSDPTLPLTVTEWEEWGDPRAEPYASYIASYSPYDNTAPGPYPALYVTAGLNDPRVSYHEPAKWVARLREVRTNDAPLLLRTEMGAGHAGPSGRYDAWRDEARVLCFLLRSLGVVTAPTS